METVTPSRRNSNNSILWKQEYFMEGEFRNTQCEDLLSRLCDVCDNAEEPPEQFHDRMMSYQTLDPAGELMDVWLTQPLDNPEMPCHLRYSGIPEITDENPTVVKRSCIDVRTSNNIVEFFDEAGFRFSNEFVVEGFTFRKGATKVTVANLVQESNPHITEPISRLYCVKLSVFAPPGLEALVNEMKAFSEQLKTLVLWRK